MCQGIITIVHGRGILISEQESLPKPAKHAFFLAIPTVLQYGTVSQINGSCMAFYRTRQGMTALHVAAEHGSLAVARLLIQAMADPNRVFAGYATPYSLAKDAWAHFRVMLCPAALQRKSTGGREGNQRGYALSFGV